MVIDPKGMVLAEGGYEPAAVTAVLDFDEMAAWREQIPCFRDRRPHCY
jgi:predicted amidohydrolase